MDNNFFPDVLTFSDDNGGEQMDLSYSGISTNTGSYFPPQGGYQESNADLNSFFPRSGLTPLGTPGMGLLGGSHGLPGYPWGNGHFSMSGYQPQEQVIPQEMQDQMTLDPNAVTQQTPSNTVSDELISNGSSSQHNGDMPIAQDKPKRGRPRKKRAKKQLTAEEEHTKRQKFLERNRLAASKCRDRKKNWTQDTVDKLAKQEKKHVELQLEFARLQANIATLMEAACHHVGHCNKEDGFQQCLSQASERFAEIGRAYSTMLGIVPGQDDHEKSDNDEDAGTPTSDDMHSQKGRSTSTRNSSIDEGSRSFAWQGTSEQGSTQSCRMSRQGSSNSAGSSAVRDSGISNTGSPVKVKFQSPTDEGFYGDDDTKPNIGYSNVIPTMAPNPLVRGSQAKLGSLPHARNRSTGFMVDPALYGQENSVLS